MGTNPAPAAAPLPNNIPPFNSSGVMPPYIGGDPTNPANMSPYTVSLVELVQRFAHSPERRAILTGFLNHRAYLLRLGVTGIQWLDGSFLEDVENVEARAPGDIDVVTFIYRPPAYQNTDLVAWQAFLVQHQQVFDSQQAKAAYHTDAYFVDLWFGPSPVIKQTSYWFGLFSHKRATGLWKGMLELSLDPGQDDANASRLLATI